MKRVRRLNVRESEVEMGFIKFLALILILLFALITWAMCIAAGITDEEAEQMYQEYMRGKYRKEREDNGIDEEED